jgi:hypothetical protein
MNARHRCFASLRVLAFQPRASASRVKSATVTSARGRAAPTAGRSAAKKRRLVRTVAGCAHPGNAAMYTLTAWASV